MAYTAKLCFEALLTELSKVNAPSMLLLDFNYFFNKAINLYVNKRYNLYDTSQQTTDDLRVLKASVMLEPKENDVYNLPKGSKLSDLSGSAFKGSYVVDLPLDYLHTLNCICIYEIENQDYKCFDKGNYVLYAAKRLTSDAWSTVINDYYNRPLPERPYYFIHNHNKLVELPTNEYSEVNGKLEGTDLNPYTDNPTTVSLSNLLGKKSETNNIRLKKAGDRLGNSSPIRMEIRYGSDDVFKLRGVLIDYIKVPLAIRLTLEQVNLTTDTSQIMEFPDYVCLEIINELVLLVMENTVDPRMQTHATVSQSIANPAQQLTSTEQPVRRVR